MKLEEMLHNLLVGAAKEDELISSIADTVKSENKEKANNLIQATYREMISFYFIESAIKLSKKTGIKPVITNSLKEVISEVYSKLVPRGEMYYIEKIYEFTKIKPDFSKSEIEEICRKLDADGFQSYSNRLRKLMEN